MTTSHSIYNRPELHATPIVEGETKNTYFLLKHWLKYEAVSLTKCQSYCQSRTFIKVRSGLVNFSRKIILHSELQKAEVSLRRETSNLKSI